MGRQTVAGPDGLFERVPGGRLVVDAERCTGCGCCEMACSLRHHRECDPSRAHISVARLRDDGAVRAVPVTCRQCEDALCVTLCPAEALRRDGARGVVVVDEGSCIGCRTCVEVCPVGAPAVDRRLGTAQKCTLCDGDPLCVKVCAERALTFADDDEEGPRRKRAALEAYLELVTAPSVAAGGVTHGNGAMTRGNGRPA